MKFYALMSIKLLLINCLIILTACQTDITLPSPAGDITGTVADEHIEFLGIPYAQAPTGALRWTPPKAMPAFSIPYSAQEFQAGCPQFAQMNSVFITSEDCLYLNIWRPKTQNTQLPVMVYIHGGGMATGAGSEARYNGQQLAINQNIIVVSLNYRLGYLGFLSLPELSQETGHSGNYAFLDQNMALQWVSKNIESFGGNPKQVTVFGESAGANSVCLHLASPISRGLFQNAILQSQGLYSSCVNTIQSQQNAQQQGQAFARIIGCEDNTLSCLRDKSLFKLNLALFLADYKMGPIHASSALPLVANIDNHFLTQQPITSFQQGLISNKNILMGVNKQEGTLFSSFDQTIQTQEQYLGALKSRYPEQHDQVAFHYPFENYPNGNQALADVLGDEAFVCRSKRLANVLAQGGSDVYFYYFTQSVNSYLKSVLKIFGGNGMDLGTFHASEIPFVFGVESIFGDLEGDRLTTSNLIQQYWGDFAKSGSVNNSLSDKNHELYWPSYTPSSEAIMLLQNQPEVQYQLKPEKCQFWLN